MLHKLILIKLEKRDPEAVDVQNILTEFGCCIKTRLGLHEAGDDKCASSGLIILQLSANPCNSEDFIKKLNDLPHVTAKLMEI
jgi:hypothetical protein